MRLNKCKKCGQTFQLGFFDIGGDYCKKCQEEGLGTWIAANQSTPAPSPAPAPTATGTEQRFGALRGYAGVLSFLGWIQIVVGIVGALALAQTLGWTVLAGGVMVSIVGFAMVVSGQSLLCFVEMEHQARRTADTLERMEKKAAT